MPLLNNQEMDNDLKEKVNACNFCQETKSRILFSATDRQYHSVPSNIWCHVVRCKKCGLIYLNPRVKENQIEKFYPQNEYYTQLSANESISKKIKNDIFRMVAYLYFKYPQDKIVFESKFNKFLLKQLAKISFRLHPFKFRYLFPYIPGGQLLDFGFGNGEDLARMKDLGWICWGVEKDKILIEKMHRKNILAFSDLWDPQISKNYFNWLTTYHSIEHVYQPKETIKRMFEIIKPGGKIYLGTPNFDSLSRWLFRSYWYNLSTPIHLYLFNKNSIINFLTAAGFKNIKIYYRSTTQGILGSLQNMINDLIGHSIKRKYTKMFLRDSLFFHLLFIPLVKISDWLHLGDRIEVVAEK